MRGRFFLVAILLVLPLTAFAGPPFRTDDPIPVDYHHGEIYLFSTGARDASGTSGLGPAVEFNYGILPDTQAHIIAPLAYDVPKDDVSHFGYGDTEVGVKYRFVRQTDTLPDIGVFPLMEIPTGDSAKGLGNGRAQFFLPVWIQKDFGDWTAYGGGGYWINPGPGNRDYWFSGVLLQYTFFSDFYLGTEVFFQTSDAADGEDSVGFNFGGALPLPGGVQILFSAGRGITNDSNNRFSYYFALYRAF